MKNRPNPDGKGVSPVLETLDEARHSLLEAPPKNIDQIATELFTSLFVLEADFRFKPVAGKTYYLYQKPDKFWLGITPPEMMSADVGGRFIGRCHLQTDLTWTLELATEVANDQVFMAWLAQRRQAFEERLGQARQVEDILPVYDSRMTFYRRASAFGVAHSLARSMSAAGIQGLSYDQARGLLDNHAPSQEDFS